ncbi:FHA domain-containing protein [Brevibacterium siliguriense]|uniref:FHA domain-containing protein n=1 Tax=Brevibacterium siliguriense TaxID=1136497 RepID=A0A1H1T3Y1_9MICO|nr:FHA domain-containing protein [Brevibacterium siliguriense]
MSQNHDQNRPTPSQPWYDNGQVPQSKKFPFGAGSGNGGDESATRMNPQVDQNGQGNTPPYGQQPANGAPQAPQYGNGQNYGAPQPASQPYAANGQGSQGQPQYQQQNQNAPQNFGQPQSGQPQGGQPQGSQGQYQYGSNGAGQFAQPQGSQGQQQYGNYPQQGGQQQYGSNSAGQYGQFDPNQQQGSQPGPGQYGQPQPGQPQSGQPQSGQPQGVPSNGGQDAMNDSGSQQFQGILDPHTGEIHPVPDLEGLQDADALLVVVSGPDSGSQILLDTDVVTVGRSPNADIFLDDVTVSRKHAEFVRTPSGFTLRDTGSLNGTYVGRQLIDSIELQNGADVQIGKFRMIFQQRPRS